MLSTIEYTVTSIVCIITAIIIQRIFIKEHKRGTSKAAINGIKWFGLAIFVWGIGAVLNIVFTHILGWSSSHKLIIYVGVVISLANSLFILLSLPSIEHNDTRGIIVRLIERFSTKEFIGLYSGVLGMIAFVFIATSYNNEDISNNFIWLIDIPISIFVALSLLYELNKAFKSRQMKFMYLPTFALFVLIIIAVSHRIIPQDQVIQVIDQQFWSVVGSITAISFKFLFILLFSILLYSWKFLSEKEQQQSMVKQLSEDKTNLEHKLEQMTLANESHLDTIKTMKGELVGLRELHNIELSDRQKEVLANLALLGQQKSYTEIAEAMHISVDGFQTHIHQIKKMLNIKGNEGKEQLIAYAKEHNLLKYATVKPNA
ncbi:response regulator transcription factor [uncultured Psychroserpens sp.]|uniref:response regulator transcription factor n=1 Tax=uncultured Psychroserpens sp. TaxID=255436 RepID=UPI0026308586|nr:LuxR family transcriptional regulator [uncultured Psychroserpens sp.]